MKRVLMLCLLLVFALGAAQAQAAPYSFGSAKLDGDTTNLISNLQRLVDADSGSRFQGMERPTVVSFTDKYVTLLALSESVSAGFSMAVLGTGIYDAADPGVWNAKGVFASAVSNDVLFSVDGESYTLGAVNLVGAFMYKGSFVYQPAGNYDAIEIEAGTVFAGLSFGNSQAIDAIVAIAPGQFNIVPIPGAVWLMGTGLAGLVALRRRNK